jgi:kynureninase
LTSRIIERADEHGYRVNAPRNPAERGGTVAVDVAHGYEVTQDLLSRDILVDYRIGAGIRIAPHFFTKEEEVDAALAAIAESLAGGSWQKFAERASVVT